MKHIKYLKELIITPNKWVNIEKYISEDENKLDAIAIVYDASNAPIYTNLEHMESLYFVLNKWCNEIQFHYRSKSL